MPKQQLSLPFGIKDTAADEATRATLLARWYCLVRDELPSMAAACCWPISQDHCFMRVCLDTSLGQPWRQLVARPAVAHLTDSQLIAAIAVADSLVTNPQSLHDLNQQSINWRRMARMTGGLTR